MNKNNEDDDQLFRDSVSNVRRLPVCDKIMLQRNKPQGDYQYRQQKAQVQPPLLTTAVSINDNISAEAIVTYCQSGVSNHQYQCLKNGQIRVEAKLDLHGYTVNTALLALEHFFSHAIEKQYRCLHIIHGKGREKALLKNVTVAFLQTQITILAYHSAPPRLGGTGSILVLLKQ